jgi:hypothetical protein
LNAKGPGLDLSTLDGLSRLVDSWGEVDLVIIGGGFKQQAPDRWHEMRYFLGLQRRAKRAVVMVHHANRVGAMRGIGRRADAMDLIMALRRPRDWQPAAGARFALHLERARHLTGPGLAPIEAQLCAGPDGCAEWQWHRGESAALRRATALLQQGTSAEAVGKAIGVSPRTAYRLQRRARELGWTARTPGYGSKG